MTDSWRLSTDSNITFPTRAKGRLYIKENKAALMQEYGDWPTLVPIPEAPIAMASPVEIPEGDMPIKEVVEMLDDLSKITRQHCVISMYKSAMLNRETIKRHMEADHVEAYS